MSTTLHNKTATSILDQAEFLTQTLGFNAFSYRDLQRDVGIKTSSIHYYFPTKQDLALAMIGRYSERLLILMKDIEARIDLDPFQKINALSDIFVEVAEAKRMCLCGMLSAEMLALPEQARSILVDFFDACEIWVAEQLHEAKAQNLIRDIVKPEDTAKTILSVLEGAILIARLRDDANHIRTIAGDLSALLKK